MQCTIALQIANSISNHGCSLDELVVKIDEIFKAEGFPGLIALLLRWIDDALNVAIMGMSGEHVGPCCDDQRLESKGLKPRKIRTSVGQIEFHCRHFRCRNCRAVQVPLLKFLKIDSHQRKTAELEEIVASVIPDQSYRRTSAHLEVVGSIVVPKSTLHDWIKTSTCDKVGAQRGEFSQIFPDGTGYKRRSNKKAGTTNRGEVKVMLGVDHEGNTVPIGAWSGESWADIGEAICPREEAKETQLYLADQLVLDGEPGMVEGLEHLAATTQRCHWHLPRDLGFTMWQDSATLRERKFEACKLTNLLAIELPEDAIDFVSEKDKEALLTRYEEAEEKLDDLIEDLECRGYSKASGYVARAKNHLFTYLGAWLDLGIRCPRTNSLIERIMREVGRRLKRIAFGWSEGGAAKMARIVLAKLLNPKGWQRYWEERKHIAGDAIIVFQGVQIVS